MIVAEHQLGGLLSVAKRAVMLDNGKACYDGDASSLIEHLSENNHPMLFEMPAGVRASASVSNVLPLLDVPSAKNWYTSYGEKHTLVSPAAADDTLSEESCISVKNLSFGYKNSKRDIIRNLSLDIKQGSITAIVGGNGRKIDPAQPYLRYAQAKQRKNNDKRRKDRFSSARPYPAFQ